MTAPLAGLRVLELARILAGPWAGQTLADLGAEVIKVEAPEGDDTRRWGPPFVSVTATPRPPISTAATGARGPSPRISAPRTGARGCATWHGMPMS
jgi:crotonobetainyl-CoA:carnitine CoA-transferase CaiB-like acyl-CoA transferase